MPISLKWVLEHRLCTNDLFTLQVLLPPSLEKSLLGDIMLYLWVKTINLLDHTPVLNFASILKIFA